MINHKNTVAYRERSIVGWAEDRQILPTAGRQGKGTSQGQHLKTIEELTELTDALEANDKEQIMDAIGDVYVTLVIQAHMNGLSMAQCIEHAYGQISSRTGKMVNGQFVKDAP